MSTTTTTQEHLRAKMAPNGYLVRMRTGNHLLDIILQVAVIAIVAAILAWIVSAVGAPGIITTIIWILALVAIAFVVLQLVQGRGTGRRIT
jgi:steroid 5-alpha reductase family enzyme